MKYKKIKIYKIIKSVTINTNKKMADIIANQPTDYFSLINKLNHLVLDKQIETLKYIINKFKIKNAIIQLMLAFIITQPQSAYKNTKLCYEKLKTKIIALIYNLRNTILTIKKKKNGQNNFNKIRLEIPYILENNINHLYLALDWYLSSNKKKKDTDEMIVSIKTPITASKVEQEYSILRHSQYEKTNEIDFREYKIFYSKHNNDETIYTQTGKLDKKNYVYKLWCYDCGEVIFDEFCQFVANGYAKSKDETVWVQKLYKNIGQKWKDEVLAYNKRKINTVSLRNNKQHYIRDVLQNFSQAENFYLDRGISYKLGFLFYGPPGTGKTSMIKAISYELQRHIYYLSLSTITNDAQLNELMNSIKFNESIIVLEDIDVMSKITLSRDESKNKQNNDPDIKSGNNEYEPNNEHLTLSGLLNQIDGVANRHGMIIIMTTNYVDRLDEALIREGRVDYKIYFDLCDNEQIFYMFSNFYNGSFSLTRCDIEKYDIGGIAPCVVENAMKKNFDNPIAALEYLVQSKKK